MSGDIAFVDMTDLPLRTIYVFAAYGCMEQDGDGGWRWTARGQLWLQEVAASGHSYAQPLPPIERPQP